MHDHEEGIKGAEATAIAIYMAHHGFLKSETRERIISDYYPLDFTIDYAERSDFQMGDE